MNFTKELKDLIDRSADGGVSRDEVIASLEEQLEALKGSGGEEGDDDTTTGTQPGEGGAAAGE